MHLHSKVGFGDKICGHKINSGHSGGVKFFTFTHSHLAPAFSGQQFVICHLHSKSIRHLSLNMKYVPQASMMIRIKNKKIFFINLFFFFKLKLMKFYDLHVHSAFSGGKSTLEELAETFRNFGYNGFCFVIYPQSKKQIEKINEKIRKTSEKFNLEIYLGVEARNLKELKLLLKRRKQFDILLARGGDVNLNRVACSHAGVDILTHPSYERNDCGLNHILAKLATKNGVAIEINFREILISSKRTRAQVMKNFKDIIKLHKKFKFPLVVCSGAISHFEICDPFVLSSLLNLLGLGLKEAKDSVSKIPSKIINTALEKKKSVLPGVRMVK